MIHQIQNEHLTVAISDIGAELQMIRGTDGTEYLWRGDSTTWAEHAPVLFPFCGRLWNGLCTAEGVPCNPEMHGFFRRLPVKVTAQTKNSITLTQQDTPETLVAYPYPFRLSLTYALQAHTLMIQAEIQNRGTRTMPFAFGLHPGFSVPFAGGTQADYTVAFPSAGGMLQRLNFDADECFPIGGSRTFALRDGIYLDPNDSLFEAGSMFFCDTPKTAVLMKKDSNRRITISFPDFPFFGLWKMPGAPFLCMEPWTSMPAMHGEATELTEKPDLLRLPAGETRILTCTLELI